MNNPGRTPGVFVCPGPGWIRPVLSGVQRRPGTVGVRSSAGGEEASGVTR